MSSATDLTAAECAALDAVDPAAVVEALVSLIAVPSVTGTGAESDIQHRLARTVTELDLDVDLWAMDLAALPATRLPGQRGAAPEGWGLVGAPAARRHGRA